MSHSKERKEKICLNCGAAIYGRYCHACGQENIEPKETFWHLITHFVYDITHFDGKFFSTLNHLLFRPGFLSKEYMKGKRMSYLNPIKMYVFTSAIFFLIQFSGTDYSDLEINTMNREEEIADAKSKTNREIKKVQKKLASPNVSATETTILKTTLTYLRQDSMKLLDTTVVVDSLWFEKERKKDIGTIANSSKFSSVKAYNKFQDSLPEEKRHNWIMRKLSLYDIKKREKYGNNDKLIDEKKTEELIHAIPKFLFLSLPLVALLFQLLYRSKKEYYYVNHGMFVIQLYIAIFILTLAANGLSWLSEHFNSNILGYISLAVGFSIFYYVYKAMRNFYGQGRGKTILKYIILFFMLLVLFVLLTILSFALFVL